MITCIFYSYLHFVRSSSSSSCVGHPRRLTSYEPRVVIRRSPAVQLFGGTIAIHCLSSITIPAHLSFTNHIYTTICRFQTLLTDLSLVFYLHIIIPSGSFPTPGNVTVLSAVLSPLRQSASESRSPRYFVAVLFGSTCLLPVLGTFWDHLVLN